VTDHQREDRERGEAKGVDERAIHRHLMPHEGERDSGGERGKEGWVSSSREKKKERGRGFGRKSRGVSERERETTN
jgi:hypothetical protein